MGFRGEIGLSSLLSLPDRRDRLFASSQGYPLPIPEQYSCHIGVSHSLSLMPC